MTPVEFVSEMRIKRAKQFLDAGETDIANIAYKVGFNGAGYFSTCFKEYYKISFRLSKAKTRVMFKKTESKNRLPLKV